METFILSIDIGIINLGFTYGKISEEIVILDTKVVDITMMKHNKVHFCDCKLHHEYCVPDYLDHFIQEYQEYFDNAHVILIERQPITGITNVQDLLYSRFRDRAILISPNKIHKYFNMSKDYDKRKKESVNIAMKYFNDFDSFTNAARKHDMSDSLLFFIYYHETNKKKVKRFCLDFEQFRFNKS
jgi:hypothetical protein